jgi:hypothetical protein
MPSEPTAGGQYHWVSVFAPPKYRKILSFLVGMSLPSTALPVQSVIANPRPARLFMRARLAKLRARCWKYLRFRHSRFRGGSEQFIRTKSVATCPTYHFDLFFRHRLQYFPRPEVARYRSSGIRYVFAWIRRRLHHSAGHGPTI